MRKLQSNMPNERSSEDLFKNKTKTETGNRKTTTGRTGCIKKRKTNARPEELAKNYLIEKKTYIWHP